MTLVDTSVWIDHLQEANAELTELLFDDFVLIHPMVVGELACGNLRSRSEFLRDLAILPKAITANDEEVFRFVEQRKLWGKGIGWIDAHLLASALITHCEIWTLDKRLENAANELKVHRRVLSKDAQALHP